MTAVRMPRKDARSARILAAAVVMTIGVVHVPPALADEKPKPPDDISSVDAYREQVPTASGPRAVGVGKPKVSSLPADARAALSRRGGADAAALERLATSSEYGAPQGSPPGRDASAGATPQSTNRVRYPAEREGAVAAAGAAIDLGDARVAVLLGGLALILAAAVGFAVRRSRRTA